MDPDCRDLGVLSEFLLNIEIGFWAVTEGEGAGSTKIFTQNSFQTRSSLLCIWSIKFAKHTGNTVHGKLHTMQAK